VTEQSERPPGPELPTDTTGWVIPANQPRRRSKLLLGCVAAAALVLVGIPLVVTAILDHSGTGGPGMQTIGFGTDGSGCELGDVASTFLVGTPIRVVGTFEPALAPGTTVTVTVLKDEVELVDQRQTTTITEPAPCFHGTLPSLEPGHYRVEYTIDPSMMPPLSGEFDVTD
jgi:hypothetical protein